MKPSVPGILCILLSCLIASCAPINNTPVASTPGNLIIYPNLHRNVLHPGDSVMFEFTSTRADIDINSVQINTGDTGVPLFKCDHNATCTENTIRAQYTYKNKGYYNVSVQQNGQALAGERILIVENYLTDEELRYEAIKDIAAEVKKGLSQVAREGTKKVAFSSLKDANFEYAEDQKDVEIIYGLMQALVESNTEPSNYVILERAPHALVRLAHEAVYTQPEDSNDPKKQTQLEYGLRTFSEEQRPLVYGIKPSGLTDISLKVNTEGRSNLTEDETNAQQKKGPINQARSSYDNEHGRSHEESHQERPVMFARFDTADFLVVIERLEDDNRSKDELVERSEQDYYDPTYNTKAIKRTARIKINARILDDNGRILWIKNITKQESDLVMPKYAPPVQRWSESKSIIPAQYPVFNLFSGLGSIFKQAVDTATSILPKK
ncbi:hypothetical protein VU04_08065 [Desulfobulbus sp. TB]|nr:hypothetical protein [Desulfobulbus sp. TB]